MVLRGFSLRTREAYLACVRALAKHQRQPPDGLELALVAYVTAQTGERRTQILRFVALDHGGGTDDHQVGCASQTRVRPIGRLDRQEHHLETTMSNTTFGRHRNKTANREDEGVADAATSEGRGITVTNLRDSKMVRLVVIGILFVIVAYLLYSVF